MNSPSNCRLSHVLMRPPLLKPAVSKAYGPQTPGPGPLGASAVEVPGLAPSWALTAKNSSDGWPKLPHHLLRFEIVGEQQVIDSCDQ